MKYFSLTGQHFLADLFLSDESSLLSTVKRKRYCLGAAVVLKIPEYE